MADLGNPKVSVRWLIEQDTPHGKYRDALYFPKERFDILKESEIEDLESARVQNWINTLDAIKSAPPRVFTKEELIAEKEALEAQKAEIIVRVSDLDQKIIDSEIKPKSEIEAKV